VGGFIRHWRCYLKYLKIRPPIVALVGAFR
jgi:hypothetical protein